MSDNYQKFSDGNQEMSFIDYIQKYHKIKKEVKDHPDLNKKKIKIALLTSFTSTGIGETLSVKCYDLGIIPEIYINKYNQHYQDILDRESDLYKFNPDLVILFIDSRSILGENFFLPYQLDEQQRRSFVDTTVQKFNALIAILKENCKGKIIVHNFEIPAYSPLGILENKQPFGYFESMGSLNAHIRNAYKNDNAVYIYDFNAFCSNYGKNNIFDYKTYYLGDVKLHFNCIPHLCNDYLSYIKPVLGLNKKCIVLDLDNTLWGGIIGEEGIEGIKLGPYTEGRSYYEFQKYLLSLLSRGIILAINSNNNPEDAIKVLKEHPHMVLKEEHFASIQINWENKIAKMIAIATDLNIGLDSMVFFDDDPMNREMVRKNFPEILVCQVPEDPCFYLKTLMDMNDFNTLQITGEDLQKHQMYVDQRKRIELQNKITNLSDFLTHLEMIVSIGNGNSFNIPRISQLTLKTNQFNMTTRRYSEKEITDFVHDNRFLVLAITVSDKFGDNGLTGVVIVKKDTGSWTIDTFLLSCRVLGRQIEDIMLTYILKRAQETNIKNVYGEFIETKKNAAARGVYKTHNFSLEKTGNSTETWKFEISENDIFEYPEYITVQEEKLQ